MADDGSIALALLTCAETFRICAPTLFEATIRRPATRETCTARLRDWASRVVKLTEMELHVHGTEHVDPNETYVVMSNHRSNYDIFILFHAYPNVLRMVAKDDLAKVPVLSGAMTAAEFVFIDRGDHGRAMEAMKVAHERLHSGISVWIAPEGTRSMDGALLPFKKGGFRLALATNTRILPATITGSGDVLAPKSWQVRRGQRVDITFHAPIDVAAYGVDRRDELVHKVREVIASGLPEPLRSQSMAVA